MLTSALPASSSLMALGSLSGSRKSSSKLAPIVVEFVYDFLYQQNKKGTSHNYKNSNSLNTSPSVENIFNTQGSPSARSYDLRPWFYNLQLLKLSLSKKDYCSVRQSKLLLCSLVTIEVWSPLKSGPPWLVTLEAWSAFWSMSMAFKGWVQSSSRF